MKNRFLCIVTLLVLIAGTDLCAKILQQSRLTGKVVMANGQSPVANAKISLDGQKFVNSNNQGEFGMPSSNTTNRPKEVYVKKLGYELANWEFENGRLTIYLRPATIKTINGILTTGYDKPLPHQMLVLSTSDNEFTAYTNDEGKFVLKIPYEVAFTGANKFIVDNTSIAIDKFEEDKEAAQIHVTLSKVSLSGSTKTSLVRVKYKNDAPVKNMIVSINGTTYITDKKGEFRSEKVQSKTVDWDFEGIEPISIDTNYQTENITVILNELLKQPTQTVKSDEAGETTMDSTQIAHLFQLNVSEEVTRLLEFYNQQSKEIEKRNEGITRITDSLTFFTAFDEVSKREFLKQLDELNRSIEVTSNDFEQIKASSLTLIKRLRSLLLKQEEIIQEIEEEKAAQEAKFKQNVMLFIYFFGIASSLLLIAIFIAKRLNAQKKVIEKMKDQLSEAQLIAKIGSMTYFLKKEKPVFSEHFFEILGINDERRINKIIRNSNQYISPELLEKNDVHKVEQAIQDAMFDEKPVNLEVKTIADHKRELYVDLRARIEQDKNGNPIAISSTLQDITGKKEKELELIAANKEAEEANKAKEQFLSTMSHEIRTPLNAIIGLTDQLIKNKPAKHQMTNLKTLQFSGEHLLTLVNDILDYSKIQAGKIKLEEVNFNLRNSVFGVINSMELMSKEKGVSLNGDIDPKIPEKVVGDKLRLNQILTNLINNGIKFTDEGSVTMEVKLLSEKKRDIKIHFNVKDTGRGIAKHRMEKIFEGFEQEDASISRKYGGTGLGLSISKQLVKLLGGKLKVTSELGKGSNFYFDAVFKKSGDEMKDQVGKRDENSKDLKDIKLLCVEDNEVNQLVISQYLESWKIKATYAYDGRQAIEHFSKNNFDVILMDIRLPDMNGFEVIRQFQKERPDDGTPVIALTAEINEGFLNTFRESKMVDYLNKPFKEEDLRGIILKYGTNPSKRSKK